MITDSDLNLKLIIDILKRETIPSEDHRYIDWEKIDVEDGESSLRKDDFRCQLRRQRVALFDVEAREFLSFAGQDFEEDSEKGRINALSNAKRAIECRMDELLTLFNFKGFSSRHGWKLPYKMQVLQTFDVPARDILRRQITWKRNLLEHEYVRPNQQEIQDIVEIAELFLRATDAYVERGYIVSATVVSTSWFKEELGEYRSPKFGYHYGMCANFELEFALEEETVTLTYRDKELHRKYDKKTEEEKGLREHVVKEEGPVTIPIRDCAMEEVRELMVLLVEKGNEGL